MKLVTFQLLSVSVSLNDQFDTTNFATICLRKLSIILDRGFYHIVSYLHKLFRQGASHIFYLILDWSSCKPFYNIAFFLISVIFHYV